MKIHASITLDRLLESVRESMFGLSSPGFCISCGEDADGVEPDARGYTCAVCDEPTVYGAEELLVMVEA